LTLDLLDLLVRYPLIRQEYEAKREEAFNRPPSLAERRQQLGHSDPTYIITLRLTTPQMLQMERQIREAERIITKLPEWALELLEQVWYEGCLSGRELDELERVLTTI
jgi:hypothetical protein